MKYSLNLLKNFISLSDDVENIAQNLILKTCEIEEIDKREIPEGVVIGYVNSVTKHPDADKLKVCEVDCGDKGKYTIVTGAENIKSDIYVPVALPNTYLPAIDLKIVPRKLRGIQSNGMICSKEELGLPDDPDLHGIRILDEDFDDLNKNDLGIPLREKFLWLENYILDVDNKTLTHRPDLTGHLGLGIELYSIYKTFQPGKISFTSIRNYLETFKNTNIIQTLEHSKKAEISVQNKSEAVRSYVLLSLKNVEVKKSDLYLQVLNHDLGFQSRSNWVDFSNIFMNLFGQPVHFFDADKISGKIITRFAKEGEKFVDLFDNEHILTDKDLVIADEEKILALAGVVGGKNSGITENTKNIAIEIANFDPFVVRKTGTRLSLRTDAELRFEKNINPVYTLYNLVFMLDSLKQFSKSLGNFEIAGVSYYISDFVYSLISAPISVSFDSLSASNFIFGEENKDFIEKSEKILEYLGFEKKGDKFVVPYFRALSDIGYDYDLYEEVARIYGYEKIGSKVFYTPIENKNYPKLVKLQRYVEEFFVKEFKFIQLETYPWVGEKDIELFEGKKLFEMTNPVDKNTPYLRDSMVYSLLDIVLKNKHYFDSLKIMDIGKIWLGIDELENNLDKNYSRNFLLEKKKAGFMLYQKKVKNWKEDGFLLLKSEVLELLKSLNVKFEIVYPNSANLHPKKQLLIYVGDKVVGIVGEIHPYILLQKGFEVHEKVFFAEIDLDELEKSVEFENYRKEIETLSTQIVWRDLSFVVDKNETFDKLLEVVYKIKEVKGIKIFDLYEGENLPQGKKSISFSVKLIGEKHLTNEDINEILNKIISEVKKVGGNLREI